MTNRIWGTAVGTIVLALALAAPTSATTFCVPGFHAACPDNGTNVAQSDLETAMQANSSDGIADSILIDSGTVTNPQSFNLAGSDPLEIIGAAPGTDASATRITSTTVGGNIYVVDLFSGGSRDVTIRDLTIVIPSSMGDNAGSGFQAQAATFDNVDIESRNPGTQAGAFIGGGTFSGGSVYGASGGTFGTGITTNPFTSGPLEITGTTIADSVSAITNSTSAVPVAVRASRIVSPVQVGVSVGGSGTVTVENSVIEGAGVAGVSAVANSASSPSATVRHVTFVRGDGPDNAPISAQVLSTVGFGDATIAVSDSIVQGYTNAYGRSAPASPSIGNANITLAYSDFPPAGLDSGDGAITLGLGNVNIDPMFASASDHHLLPGSPVIDAADPAPALAVNQDFDGLPRPVDGNGDGSVRADMGAFEYQPPVTPAAPAPAPGTATTTPKKKCKKGFKLKKVKGKKKCVRKKKR